MRDYSSEIEQITDMVLNGSKERTQEAILLVIAQLLNNIGQELTQINKKLGEEQ